MEQEAVKLVLDASVAVKWFVKEENRDLALKLREEHAKGRLFLSAPDMIIFEIINALKHSPELSEVDVRRASESLFMIHMELHQPTIELMKKATENAFKHSITIYDAAYLSLSELDNCPMVTADEESYGKMGPQDRVMLLSSDHFLKWLENLGGRYSH